ncbi:hypothetical protein [Kiritimatiella glycovorans]|uniref:Transporter n=1 Tax=Kiritimatiella glycovorans TaxID=1307763 RepID=A0A0G3ECI0_9BACT|nr:hypothetical protein [Kiritimatiella glycovorans]AKJ64216.1 hypothetical protein L21SP4_00955 [Kiritimatiella glycovorans]
MIRRYAIAAAMLLVTAAAGTAGAQEPTFMEAATHPGADQLYARSIFSAGSYERDGEEVDDLAARLKLAYGLRGTLALLVDADWAHADREGEDETGLRFTTLRLKQRVLQRDFGPLNTWRASLLGGASFPGDHDTGRTGDTFPRFGVVSTTILDRHGFNAHAEWLGYRDEPDAVLLNGSYLYRLVPAEYSAATRGAWYTMTESLNAWTDGGDTRSDAALGLLYEATRWAWEVSLRLPVERGGSYETKYRLATGVRWLF